MSKDVLINKIKNVIINNLAVNESIIAEVHEYNDVVQGGTLMAFTQSRIFFWHETGESSKMKTKSYNLVKFVFVSRGVFAIHFNDEIVKFLVSETSDETTRMIDILSQYVDIQYTQSDINPPLPRKGAKKPSKDTSSSVPQERVSIGKTIVKMVGIVLLVVIVSSLGTLGFSAASDWWTNRNVDQGLTTEKVEEIKAEIGLTQTRIFLFEEYKKTLDNYASQLTLISADISVIDPTNSGFDWSTSINNFNNYKLGLYNLAPQTFEDNGKVFDLGNDYMANHSQNFYNQMTKLLDGTLLGLSEEFSTVADLVNLGQSATSLRDDISGSLVSVDEEITKLNLYIQELNLQINQ